VEDKRNPWGRSFLKRGELGGWDLWCLWEFVVHSNGQCDQRSTKLFPYSQPENKTEITTFFFLFSHSLSFAHYQFTSWMKRERERERERYLNNFKIFWCKQTKEEVSSSS
jgi:hypothetical protein